jgi:peptidoglycan/xylan/chitin deacetylase (PgdA/CDA1 family)
MKKAIKALLGRSLAAVHLDHWLLREGAIVVAFHRVQPDDGRDSLTMPVEEFQNYCKYFKDHFDVVGLPDIVRRIRGGRSLSRALAVTFDDGYRDNFEFAAPVLDRLGLPATFFVVTDWIGTKTVAWWDREQRKPQPWMTWNHVRALHAHGFDIGAHTRTHVDLGAVPEQQARDEVMGSRFRLEEELATSVQSFAYPYGRRENISRGVRRVVREAGFTCCCSSYGGMNRHGTDPFQLMRIPVAPENASPHQFGFDVAFKRTLQTA